MSLVTFEKTTHAEMTGSMERSHAYTGRSIWWELVVDGVRMGEGLTNKADAIAAAEWLTSIGYNGRGDWKAMWRGEKVSREIASIKARH